MKKNIQLLGIIGFFSFSSTAYAVGQCNSNLFGANTSPCCSAQNMSAGGVCYVPADQTFQFTIVSFGFERADGSVVNLGSNTVFNAASADAGNVMGSFVSGASLPAGTYVAVRPSIHLATTMNNSAVTTTDGRTCSAGISTGMFQSGGAPVCGAGEPNANVTGCLNASDNNIMEVRDASLGNIVYDGTSPLTVDFTFNTGNGVACTFAPGVGSETSKAVGPLSVSMSLH